MCQHCGWESVLDRCEVILAHPEAEWCTRTVIGIMSWINSDGHVTDRQRAAIKDIERKLNLS